MARAILLGVFVAALLAPGCLLASRPAARLAPDQGNQLVAVPAAPRQPAIDSPSAQPTAEPQTRHATLTGAYAVVRGDTASLYTAAVRRDWRLLPGGGEVTVRLRDEATGKTWTQPESPDFAVTVDGVQLTSLDFGVESVIARQAPTPASRPPDVGVSQLVFTLDFPAPGLPT